MKFNFNPAQQNDVVQTSAAYGAFSGEKQVKQVQRAAMTIVTAAASAISGFTTRSGDNWSKKVRSEFESMTIHLINSVEGKRRTYSVADVMNAFQIGNALQLADSTLHGIKKYIEACVAYKVNHVTAASTLLQTLDSNITFVEGLLDSFPVSPWVKDLVKLTGYYPGNRNHTNTAFLIDEIGLWNNKEFLDGDANCESYYLTVDIAQESDGETLSEQVATLMSQIVYLIDNTTREAAADLISYGKGSLRGIKCSGLGAKYDTTRKLICNSVGGYAPSGAGFNNGNDGTYYYEQIGVKWASLIIGYSQDHSALKDAVAAVVGNADGSGLESTELMAGCFGYFSAEEDTSTGTVKANIVSLVFTKWIKHLTDEGQIWVWLNDRIDFDRYNDWDEASTNLPLILTNVTSGFRDGFNLSYNAGATGRQACYFSTLADAEFTYYPIRLLDFAKDYIPNMITATVHVDTEKLRDEKKNLNKQQNKQSKPVKKEEEPAK